MSDLILGVSGLRGVVGETLTPEVAVRYAAAFGAWLREQLGGGTPSIVIGRDGRWGGDGLYRCVSGALLGAGCNVTLLDVAMTPTVGVIVDWLKCDAGVIITASHNPDQWNGIKLLLSPARVDGAEDVDVDACAPNAQQANEIITRFKGGVDGWGKATSQRPGPVDRAGGFAENRHLAFVDERLQNVLGISLEDIRGSKEIRRVVVDSVNASGSRAVAVCFGVSRVQLIQLAGHDTGIFPHTPEPTAENLSGAGGLCDAVPGLKADVGFAQDPDGDRLAIVDERGRYIGEEYTLAIAAEAILGAMQDRVEDGDPSPRPSPQKGEGGREDPHPGPLPSGTGEGGRAPVIVTNLSTSRMVEDVAAAYGARVERTAVGEANVVERMKALKAAGERVVLGGEGNGGVIWPEVTYVRDSLGAMALTLGVMARTGLTVSGVVAKIDGYARAGKYSIVKRKQAIAHKADAQPAVERVAAAYAAERVDRQDGVRVDFTDQGGGERAGSWVHVRASNTEPIMRLIAEAPGEAAANAILDEVARVIEGG